MWTPDPSRARAPGAALAVVALLALGASSPAFAQTPPPAAGPPNPDDILGNIVVVAGAGARPLPKIGVLPSTAAEIEDVTARNVVRGDLDLCGEFEVLPDSAAPDGLYLADSPIDVKAWSAKGVEAVVKVTGKKGANNHAELRAQAYFTNRGQAPVYDARFLAPEAELRPEAHHLADLVIGALTGTNGSFASHMAFSSGMGSIRRVFTVDADGDGLRRRSATTRTGCAPCSRSASGRTPTSCPRGSAAGGSRGSLRARGATALPRAAPTGGSWRSSRGVRRTRGPGSTSCGSTGGGRSASRRCSAIRCGGIPCRRARRYN
jgi:hypothetical protein